MLEPPPPPPLAPLQTLLLVSLELTGGFQPKAPSRPNLVWQNGASNMCNVGEGQSFAQQLIISGGGGGTCPRGEGPSAFPIL